MPYSRRLAALLRRRAWSLVVFAVLLLVFDGTRAWSGFDVDQGLVSYLESTPITNLFLIIGATLAPLLVEAASLRAGVRGTLTVIVTFLAVGVLALVSLHVADGPLTSGVRHGTVLSNEAYIVRTWWLYSAAGLLFAVYCRTHDRQLATIRSAQAAELARADAQRDIVASRLQVLQARVEPELLFEVLADVKLAYLRDPAAAGMLLDDLIAYLRAALPQMRAGPSTLLREAALAEAYLKVTPTGRSGALVTEVRIAEHVGAIPFPPMVLLPLVHAASEVAPPTVLISAPAHGIATRVGDNSIAIRLVTSAVIAGWDEARLPAIRSVLQQFFGMDALLRIEHAGDEASATVTWPVNEAPDSTSLPAAMVST
jgi:hypothetical protein